VLGIGNTTPYMYSITPVFTNDFSVSLDGTDDFINADVVNNGISGWSDIHEEGTISVWAKIGATSSTGTIVRLQKDSNNYITLFYHAGSNETRAAWKVNGSGSSSNTVASDNPSLEDSGNFHHIVYSWAQAGKIKLYVDGQLLDTKPGGATQLPAWNTTGGDIDNISIGQNTSGSSFFNGNINNFSLWEKELTLADVLLVYNSGVPNDVMTLSTLSPHSKCIAYYKCEPDAGTSSTNLVNSSILGLGNDATLTNGANYDRH
tara:strand:+ start:1117 stop:1899 length:783 start_codon:yes stop_codon:yes gene_type:complete